MNNIKNRQFSLFILLHTIESDHWHITVKYKLLQKERFSTVFIISAGVVHAQNQSFIEHIVSI